MGDLNRFLERFVALRQSIVDDGIQNEVPFHKNDIQMLIERSRSEGSSFVKVTIPLLGKALDAGLIGGIFICPAGFSIMKGTRLPRFLNACFKQVFNEADGSLRSLPNITTMYFLRQFLLLDSKLESAYSPDQEKAAVDGFRARQKKLGKTKLPVSHPVLYRAQRLITRMMKHCDLRNITPGHGPGGVAESYDRFTRWDIRAWPSRAERWYPYDVYGSQSFQALCTQGPPVMVKYSVTKCSLVPKDFKGPRLISSESTATQYLQQGQMKLLMQYVDRHWLMSKSIRFRDQTRNQEACRQAYANGSVTLDLSNASDTVSAALVWYLFAGVPTLRSQLFCTRSQYMDVKGERIRITAFSPMGSAVCFPVETLVFWALSMASVRFVQHHWSDGSKDPSLPSESEMASAVAVFGDDIIVPDYALAVLIGTLTEVGCEVNTSKTCSLTPFRESCGAEYFNHTDVAIIRNRRYDYDDSKEIINIPALLDLQRKFFLCGLYNTAALLRQWAEEIRPIVTQTPPGTRAIRVLGIDDIGAKYVIRKDDASRFILDSCIRKDAFHQYVVELPRREGLERDEGCLSAVPSGFGRSRREEGAFDRLCCAFWFDNSLSCGMRTRYNERYQRYECRVPGRFQLTRNWPSHDHHPSTAASNEAAGEVPFGRIPSRDAGPKGVQRGLPPHGDGRQGNRFVPTKARVDSLWTGYPRLLSRVVGDSVERIAIRNTMFKMAWSEIPFPHLFQGVVR